MSDDTRLEERTVVPPVELDKDQIRSDVMASLSVPDAVVLLTVEKYPPPEDTSRAEEIIGVEARLLSSVPIGSDVISEISEVCPFGYKAVVTGVGMVPGMGDNSFFVYVAFIEAEEAARERRFGVAIRFAETPTAEAVRDILAEIDANGIPEEFVRAGAVDVENFRRAFERLLGQIEG